VRETIEETVTTAFSSVQLGDDEAGDDPQQHTELYKLWKMQEEAGGYQRPFRPRRSFPVSSEPEKRVAEDGSVYTKEEFIEFYGGTDEWDAAPKAESGGDGGGQSDVCNQWRRGNCTYGDSCKFRHDGPGGSDTSQKKSGVCFAWQNGECTRGDSCRFVHEGDGTSNTYGGYDAPSEAEKRIAEDGSHYTKQEFIDFYGGTDQWDAAPKVSSEETAVST
jgi:hypothetical protein